MDSKISNCIFIFPEATRWKANYLFHSKLFHMVHMFIAVHFFLREKDYSGIDKGLAHVNNPPPFRKLVDWFVLFWGSCLSAFYNHRYKEVKNDSGSCLQKWLLYTEIQKLLNFEPWKSFIWKFAELLEVSESSKLKIFSKN